MSPVDPTNRDKTRIIKFLARGKASIEAAAAVDKIMLDGCGRGVIAVAVDSLSDLHRSGTVTRNGDTVKLTADGEATARRLASADPFQDQHRDLQERRIQLPEGMGVATVNLNESPLAQLSRRRAKSGAAFLTESEVRAGERLRSDYTHGNIMPRLGANWIATVASGKRGAGGSSVDLTDNVLAARQRVENAIEAVGPELAGILIDVCCFLKGLETVEAERCWPARSAKIVLKTALSALSRHYEPPAKKRRFSAFHWGAQDFKPALT